jgi:hypothetical protein
VECRLRVSENRALRRTFGPQGSGEDYITKSICSVTLTKYYLGDRIKKNEMGREHM